MVYLTGSIPTRASAILTTKSHNFTDRLDFEQHVGNYYHCSSKRIPPISLKKVLKNLYFLQKNEFLASIFIDQ